MFCFPSISFIWLMFIYYKNKSVLIFDFISVMMSTHLVSLWNVMVFRFIIKNTKIKGMDFFTLFCWIYIYFKNLIWTYWFIHCNVTIFEAFFQWNLLWNPWRCSWVSCKVFQIKVVPTLNYTSYQEGIWGDRYCCR